MRRILIVEDDENKRMQLVGFFATSGGEFEVEVAKSLRSGIQLLLGDSFDLVVTDMTMPTFDIDVDEDGGRVQAYAGREVLRYMERRGLRTSVVVVTQFDRFGEGSTALTLAELDAQLHESHKNIYRGAVYFDTASESWKEKLTKKISEIFKI